MKKEESHAYLEGQHSQAETARAKALRQDHADVFEKPNKVGMVKQSEGGHQRVKKQG